MAQNQGTITISGHADPDLNGTITFHTPTLMEKVRIEQRAAHLARPVLFENLPPDGRALVTLIATLEHVIDNAPKGFYTDVEGRPRLDLGNLSTVDDDLLWQVYAAVMAAATTFRNKRTGGAKAVAGEAGSAPLVGSGDTNEA